MPITRPFRRTCRLHTNGSYANNGVWAYITHPKYAKSPEHYIRAFLLIQKDLHELFDYVEPAEKNLQCFSYRIHALLMRTCVEIEANLKAILLETGYAKTGDWNMSDYKKVNPTHHLSSYEIRIPSWHGSTGDLRRPFEEWGNNRALPWYRAYNETKHDRHTAFENASFDHLLSAVSGLAVVLAAQFWTHDFAPSDSLLSVGGGPNDGMESAIGNYLRIRFPSDWNISEIYDFDWQRLESESDPFQTLNYT